MSIRPNTIGAAVATAALAAVALAPAAPRADRFVVAPNLAGPTTPVPPQRAAYAAFRLEDADWQADADPVRALFWGVPVPLNRAGAAALETISGIGPATAAAILAARTAAGGFTGWDQVDAVAGIGPARLATLQSRFFLEDDR